MLTRSPAGLDIALDLSDQQLVVDVQRFIALGVPEIHLAFAHSLGCPTLDWCDRGSLLETLSASRLAVVQEYLPRVLVVMGARQENPAALTSLLGGVYRHRCWQRCLGDEAGAYSFACALLTYIESYTEDFAVDVIVKPDVISILNEWLSPSPPWESLPTANIIARHMFGAGWCELFLPESTCDPLHRIKFYADGGNDDASPDYAAGRLVLELRPPFLPGLCVAQQSIQEVSLPVDMWPPL